MSVEPRSQKAKAFDWTRSETLALAQQSCSYCYGLGLRPGRAGQSTPCNCVFRAVFRSCYAHFRAILSCEKRISHAAYERRSNRHAGTWSLKDEEFSADFCLVSRRTLSEKEHRIFRFHYLLGADWKLCCQKLGMVRGDFFHAIYRIEQKLGRAFRELRPYALFPLDEYFHCNVHKETKASALTVESERDEAETAPLFLRFAPKLRYRCA
jgi:hypothetical protein